MYDHYEDALTISVYDDHAASAGSDELEYTFRCDGCAEERDGDVNHLSTTDAGEWACCDDCGSTNRTGEEEEEEDY